MRMEFETSSDEIAHERQVYTLLDMLGDVGGLLDMLMYLGQIVLAIIFKVSGSETIRYLAGALFYRRKEISPYHIHDSNEESSELPRKVLKQLNRQRPVKISRCLSLLAVFGDTNESNKHARFLEKADSRISSELDIVNFIQLQKMTRLALKVVFTKFEYFLLKRQKEFVIDSESSANSDDDYSKS